MMSKGIDLKQAKLKDLNTILQMKKRLPPNRQNRANQRQNGNKFLFENYNQRRQVG